MGIKRFFELANQQWPVEEGKPRHGITFDPEKGLVIAIWLHQIKNWQTFYATDDEFDNPEGLIAGMINLLKLVEQKADHAR